MAANMIADQPARDPVGPPAEREPTPSRLLAGATEHIRRHGLARTTLVLVAREAGVSHAAAYRYYASKQALVDAVTESWLRGIELQLAGVADSPDPADDKLERMMLLLARLYRDQHDREPNLYAPWLHAWAERRPAARRHRRRVRALVERVIEEGRMTQLFQPAAGRGPGKPDGEPAGEGAVPFLYDVLHRFIDPAAIAAERDIDRASLDARLARVLRVAVRALAQGAV